MAFHFTGYGVILQIKINSNQSKPGLPDQSKTVLVPTIVKETSTVTGNESIPIPPAAVPAIIDSASNKNEKSQSEEPVKQIPPQKTQATEAKPTAIKVIPYEGEHVTVPFKQEKETETLPILKPNKVDMASFGEKVLQDIAAQKGDYYAANEKSKEVNEKEKAENAANQINNETAVTENVQPIVNQSADLNSDIHVSVAFDIFMTWNPKMLDPTFPPRLNVLKLLNEAVSIQILFMFDLM